VEAQFRQDLLERYGIRFHSFRLLTNMPIGRFAQTLEQLQRQGAYLELLQAAFNPATVEHLACRTTLVMGWDGLFYDCDFNLGAGRPIREPSRHVFQYHEGIARRRIAFGPHCFACTAHSGSS
jgi:hypothetical protein